MVPEEYRGQLEKLMTVFLQENQKLNLSALRTEEKCWIGNVMDSVMGVGVVQQLCLSSIPQPLPPKEEGELCLEHKKDGLERKKRERKPLPKNTKLYAREMRKNPTEAEDVLWQHIRKDQLGIRFRRQYVMGGVILDYYAPAIHLAVEVDGGIHNSKDQKETDQRRDAYMREKYGITTLRISNEDVLHNMKKTLTNIQKHIHIHSPSPQERGLGGEDKGLGVGAEQGLGGEEKKEAEAKILDIGTGGGFPLLPLAICLPNTTCTGLDSTKKKLNAIQRITDALQLTNLQLVTGRTEELGHNSSLREQFDVVTARAVAPLPTLLEYAASFVKTDGHFIAWKSIDIQEELRASNRAQRILGLELIDTHHYTLPDTWGKRQLLVFKKTKPLEPTYPRITGIPKKDPLIDEDATLEILAKKRDTTDSTFISHADSWA